MIKRLYAELQEKMESTDFAEVYSVVVGTLLKGYKFKKTGQASFNDGGMPSSQVDRMGFHHEGEDVTVILETTQDYHPVVENNRTHYESEFVIRVRFKEGKVADLEFCGNLEDIKVLERREREELK